MGEEQRLPASEQLAGARAAFEAGSDFTLAVEEEFALLDPETLSLVNRFEELRDAGRGSELEEHLVGELIASEIEVRTGRCTEFAEAAAKMAARRGALQALAREHAVTLGATGTHPWSRWQQQRIIDTPHYRRNNELLRYVVWRNNTFGLHVHVGIRGADRAVAVCNALRAFLPELLALSASSPFVEESRKRAPLRAHARSSRAPSPAAASPTPTPAGRATRSTSRSSTAPARSTSTRSFGGASVPTSPTRRSRSASATPSPTSARLRRSRRSPTRSRRAAHARSTRESRCSTCRVG